MKTPLGATTRMVPGDPKSARRPSTTGDTKNTKNTNTTKTTNTKKKNWTMRQTFASAGVIMLGRLELILLSPSRSAGRNKGGEGNNNVTRQ